MHDVLDQRLEQDRLLGETERRRPTWAFWALLLKALRLLLIFQVACDVDIGIVIGELCH